MPTTPKTEIFFKNVLEKHGIDVLKATLETLMAEIEEKQQKDCALLVDLLKHAGTPQIALRRDVMDTEAIDKLRKHLNKRNYHFPDAYRPGNLVNIKSTPSQIYPENKFISTIPFLIPTQRNGVAFLMNPKHKDLIIHLMEQMVVNMILSLPDGMVKLTVIDQTGSGQNFPIMSLFNEKFIEGKVLSEQVEIEKELAAAKNSMSTISQAISNSGFRTIEEYNVNTDEIPQRYNFIVINDFPSGFNKSSSDNLFSLIESGFRSGIYVFMTSKFEKALGLSMSVNGGHQLGTFLKHMTTFEFPDRNHKYIKDGVIKNNIEVLKCPIIEEDAFKSMVNARYKIAMAPEPFEVLEQKVKYLNDKIININLQPMVRLEKIIPPKEEWYSKQAWKGVSVPFGKKGIENINFSIGVNKQGETENVHHGIICGMTGSGKTVTIHDILIMSSIYYSPKELQFWLLDYKEGTEFALYKDFPQVQILSMESEMEFGHDVLRRAIEIIKERGALFKEMGANNLASYNSKVDPKDRLPRIMIIIDEFQELLRGDQRSISITNNLFDDILRRGRSFGVNLFLSTQTLHGVDLGPAILSNTPLRIGLRMGEKDAAKVFSEDNNAVKFLEHPGQGIYNNSAGLPKANVAFQACFIDDEGLGKIQKELLDYMVEELGQHYLDELSETQFIFYGSLPGNYENNPEKDVLDNGKIFFGEPIGLSKKHEFFMVQKSFGENFILTGSKIEQMITTQSLLVKQFIDKLDAKLYFANFSGRLDATFDKALSDYENKIIKFNNQSAQKIIDEVYEIFNGRDENAQSSAENDNGEPVFVVLSMIENCRFLSEKSNDTKKKFLEMVSSGPDRGIHFMISAMNLSTITEFDLRTVVNSKFKKRFAFAGGSAIKTLSQESTPGNAEAILQKSPHTAFFEDAQRGEAPRRFKVYKNEEIAKSIEEAE